MILLIILLVIVFGYLLYDKIRTERQYQQAAGQALITAQVWLATAKYRQEPERFIAFRDSLLTAHNLSRKRMEDYLSLYKNKPEKYDLFARLVNQYIDSLCAIEIGIPQADTSVEGDSIGIRDKPAE